MRILHEASGAVLTWAMNNKYILLTLNILLPTAIYFEAGPVSAFTAYFGFFLVVSIAMGIAREDHEKAEMTKAIKEALGASLDESLGPHLKRKGENVTEFETENYKGSITTLDADNLPDDLPDEIKELIESKLEKSKEDEPTKH